MTKIKDSDIEVAKRLEATEDPLTQKKYDEMTLGELLETRERIQNNKAEIQRMNCGHAMYTFATARLQKWIHYRRTHRKSGLVIPYNKEINHD